jgi:hypothetical protein
LRTSYRPRAWEELVLLRSRARFGSARPGDAMNANRAPAEPDHDGREEAAAGQTKPRRSKGEPHRSIVTLEQLPLFADERSLSEAVLGHGQSTHWRAVVTLLEGRGFPKIDGLMGGRYVPAVRAFFAGNTGSPATAR